LRAEAIQKLKAENIFVANKEKYLPKLINRLAVISVETSKGWRDFSQTLEESKYDKLIDRKLFPAKLQGDAAVVSITKALVKIAAASDQFDAVAIIRGGGGDIGMDCYDNFDLAKTVATFPLPVLTGIGHSTNLTVVEMCVYRNLITPTALGQFLIQGYEEFEQRLQKASYSLKRVGRQVLPLLVNRLDGMTDELDRRTREQLTSSHRGLLEAGRKLERSVKPGLTEQNKALEFRVPLRLNQAAEGFLNRSQNRVRASMDSLEVGAPRYCFEGKNKVTHIEEKLRLLDPQNVLKRGYSITIKNGKAVTSATNLKEGDEVTTRLAAGSFTSTVKTKKNG
jgi:exodeoxyribonuclease VII large subunit